MHQQQLTSSKQISRNDAPDNIDSEDASKSNGREHDRKCVSDDDVSNPECEGTDGNAEAVDARRDDHCAENVRGYSKCHDEAAGTAVEIVAFRTVPKLTMLATTRRVRDYKDW